MNGADELHSEAMELADLAFLASLEGQDTKAMELFGQAFHKEQQAARLLASETGFEPSRSVLCRSAASLALQCNQHREAEKLISLALSGNPPPEIADELRDLLDQVHFHRHLELRGITLKPNEFQFSLVGKLVGSGIADSEEFVGRVRNLETLVYRTAERKTGREFREAGRRAKDLHREVQLYVSVPRAGSFAVSFRIGHKEQMALPGLDLGVEVIDELMECLECFDAGDTEHLHNKITDSAYYRSFVGLARAIAPDGEDVRKVGLTAMRGRTERVVVLSKPRRETPTIEPGEGAADRRERVQVRGTLLFADAVREKGIIKVVDGRSRAHKFRVPTGMMSDIVRPLWESQVVATGRREGKETILEDIEESEEGPDEEA